MANENQSRRSCLLPILTIVILFIGGCSHGEKLTVINKYAQEITVVVNEGTNRYKLSVGAKYVLPGLMYIGPGGRIKVYARNGLLLQNHFYERSEMDCDNSDSQFSDACTVTVKPMKEREPVELRVF